MSSSPGFFWYFLFLQIYVYNTREQTTGAILATYLQKSVWFVFFSSNKYRCLKTLFSITCDYCSLFLAWYFFCCRWTVVLTMFNWRKICLESMMFYSNFNVTSFLFSSLDVIVIRLLIFLLLLLFVHMLHFHSGFEILFDVFFSLSFALTITNKIGCDD